jgi:hypothetical protein
MAKQRTVELCIDPDTMVDIATITGNEKLFHAIGYLSQWNLPLAKVHISACMYESCGNPEIIATYWRHNTTEFQPIAYQIGAVWHGDHFGFHS